jgi:hypothetical protein
VVQWGVQNTGQAFVQHNNQVNNFIDKSHLMWHRCNDNGNAKHVSKMSEMGSLTLLPRNWTFK